MFIISSVFVLLFFVLNFFIGIKDLYISKLDYFECGFVCLGWVNKYFSMNFFVMMLIFVIFDLEVVMLIGFLISSSMFFFSFILVFFFIIFGFYLEWYAGKLLWMMSSFIKCIMFSYGLKVFKDVYFSLYYFWFYFF